MKQKLDIESWNRKEHYQFFKQFDQASHSEFADSCPKFSIGKLVDEHGKKFMMISIHVHHALVDGYHLGLFYDQLQVLLDED